jgi:diaminopimelate epimerase
MRTWSFTTGHGTKNDFVMVMDRSGLLNPSEDDVRYLCDRRVGLGADGFIRAVKAGMIDEWSGDPELWFMDYRNADGSLAEMCANGLRVFIRWLIDQGLASADGVDIATRAGVRHGSSTREAHISVSMGQPTWTPEPAVIEVSGVHYEGNPVDVGNPHLVVRLETLEELRNLDLTTAPLAPDFPQGVNVELVVATGERQLSMRVYERGVGETMSCGTGVVAASLNAKNHESNPGGHQESMSYRVSVPGGDLSVDFVGDEVYLSGEAVIIAHGKVTMPDG